MRQAWLIGFILLAITLVNAGCQKRGPSKEASAADQPSKVADKATQESDEVSATLANLSPEDRPLAAAQRLCPISDEPLGSMGVPPKLTIGDQPVFLCCGGCQKAALADPIKTLAKVKELREMTPAPK